MGAYLIAEKKGVHLRYKEGQEARVKSQYRSLNGCKREGDMSARRELRTFSFSLVLGFCL